MFNVSMDFNSDLNTMLFISLFNTYYFSLSLSLSNFDISFCTLNVTLRYIYSREIINCFFRSRIIL